jgi:hypothetical protein
MKLRLFLPFLLLTTSFPALAASAWTDLLDAKLTHWDVYLSFPGDAMNAVIADQAPPTLRPIGWNKDEKRVFSVIDLDGEPVLKITGEIYGAAISKQEYGNYHFRAEFKWGERKWQPRLEEPKDSGILYHGIGEPGVDYWHSWMQSQEFQIIEGGIGDYWSIAGSQLDVPAVRPAGAQFYIYQPGARPVTFGSPNAPGVVANYCQRGEDREIPGGWNSIELVCFAERCVHIANGKVVMAVANSRVIRDGKPVPLVRGKLQIQSEAAEVYFRRIQIRGIETLPEQYRQYF